MSSSTTATMTSAIPQRPSSRPPPPISPPPSGPLPALPLAKTRKPLPETPDESQSRPSSRGSVSASISTNAGIKPLTRAVTTSGLPTPKPSKSQSTPAVPTLNTTHVTNDTSASTSPLSALPTPGKAIRKPSSIANFPPPPKNNTRVNSLPPSPLASTIDVNDLPALPKGRPDHLKHRNSDFGIKKVKTRSSGYGLRTRQSTGAVSMIGQSPSLLNGTGDSKLISSAEGARVSDSFLSVPSRSESQTSSANGSYLTDATQYDDGPFELAADEPQDRGRPKSQETSADNSPNSKDKDTKGNVIVSVRVRPDAARGDEAKTEGEWMVDGRRALISYNGREGGDYRYDNVFSPHDHNARVYDSAAKRLVRRVMEGYHGTVFAYGMTGTGKTFSMQGTANSPGVIPLAITDIFSYIRENPNREFLLRVSYLEIYNEKIYDLLSQSTPGVVEDLDIKLREDPKRGVYATPLKEEIVQSPTQLLRVIARGDLARRTAGTQYNARSSRSHAVVQIVVESRERTPTQGSKSLPGGVLVSTLSLIDLAGSEKAAENKERRTEGAHINKSLLTLGTVIARLSGDEEKEKEDGAKPSEKDKEKGVKHLPYRDSKLTRLLQPALSGDSLVSILCTIQLSSVGTSAATTGLHTGETLNTLKFASRAKNNIVSHAKRNESNPGVDAGSRALLDRYRLEIQELRAQLDHQSKEKEETEKQDEIAKDLKIERDLERQEKERHEEQMLEMQLARTALKERISHLNRLILSSRSLGVNLDSGRVSSMSVPVNRMSTASSNNEFGRPVSTRSRQSSSSNSREHRDSTAANEEPMPNAENRVSAGSITPGIMPAAAVSQLVTDENALEDDDGEEDSGGPDGTGEAPLLQQNRMLQLDIADKNRYIATLEKRLLQARRTSRSRVSMTLGPRSPQLSESGNAGAEVDTLLRDKDREIEELKAKLDDQTQKLDDQTRMVTALRSAARKRDTLENRKSLMSEDTERPATAQPISNGLSSRKNSSRTSNRSLKLNRASSHLSNGHVSNPSTASRSSTGGINFPKTPLSPMALLSPSGSDNSDTEIKSPRKSTSSTKAFRRKSVDEMTMLLDQMIQDKVESGRIVRGQTGSLRVKRDTVIGMADTSAGAAEKIQEEEENTSET